MLPVIIDVTESVQVIVKCEAPTVMLGGAELVGRLMLRRRRMIASWIRRVSTSPHVDFRVRPTASGVYSFTKLLSRVELIECILSVKAPGRLTLGWVTDSFETSFLC